VRSGRLRRLKSAIEQRFVKSIQQSGILLPGGRVGVAVSGGADSVALFRLFEKVRGELGLTLLVVHFNHSLRAAESDEDARFVSHLAESFGCDFICAKEDVAAHAARDRGNLEEVGRRLRSSFFARLVDESRATRIAVAHTADDQAETVLAHMIRGTGPAGLAGIYPQAGPIVRPLLGMRRQDLRQYLQSLGQPWREDSSNQDTQRMRARIRAQLLPRLEADFSPQIVSHLCELGRLSREEEVSWAALVEERMRSFVEVRGKKLAIRLPDLLAFPGLLPHTASLESASDAPDSSPLRPLTERLIRRLYERVRGDRRELSAANVEQVIRLCTSSSSGHRVQLPGAIAVERDFNTLIFSRASVPLHSGRAGKTPSQTCAYQYVVELSDSGTAAVSVPELGTCFRLKVIDWPLAPRDTKRDGQALDADLLRGPLVLRSWRHGDAYRPSGRRHSRKLKQMFLAGRVPSGERSRWPVLESGGSVVWARGMAPAADFCATDQTRAGLLIEEDGI
jgi:tRNA(Ile)-lysidine synthase